MKEQMDKLGVECVVIYRDMDKGQPIRHGGGTLIRPVDFIAKQFTAARKR